MEQIVKIIHYVSIVVAVVYSLQFLLTIIAQHLYSEKDKLSDMLNGVTRTFNPSRPLFKAAIAFAVFFATV